MLEMMIQTMFVIGSIIRITGIDISKKPKCAKKNQPFRKVWKHCKSLIQSVRSVGNDDLNYVCHS